MEPGLDHDRIIAYNETRAKRVVLRDGPREAMLTREVLRHIPDARGRLLEVGCGDGHLLRAIADRFPYELHGVDVSETRIRRTREAVTRATVLLHDIVEKPYLPSEFDVVICSETLEHIDRLDDAIRNMVASLKRGGLLIVTVPNEERLAVHECPRCGLEFNEFGHLHSFSERRLRSALEPCGDVVTVKPFGRPGDLLKRIVHRVKRKKPVFLLGAVRAR